MDGAKELEVIVYESGDRRFASELRHVQEVISLGYVTPMPLSPAAVHGATSVRGRLVPVISLEPFFGSSRGGRVLPGTSAMLVSCAEGAAAIPVRRVLDVISVPRARFEVGGEGSGPLVPGSFRGPAGSVPLLDVPLLLLAVQTAARQACEALFARVELR